MLAGADPNELASSGTAERPVLTGRVRSITGLAGRLGEALPVGNEGAGTIVESGSSAAAQALLGRVVAASPGQGMHAEYRMLRADQCLALDAGTSAVEGASACINPLTALGFVETMRREGHVALANTAAASNLGQMLVRICLKDGIPFVNIVRSAERATIAFDAIGGVSFPVSCTRDRRQVPGLAEPAELIGAGCRLTTRGRSLPTGATALNCAMSRREARRWWATPGRSSPRTGPPPDPRGAPRRAALPC